MGFNQADFEMPFLRVLDVLHRGHTIDLPHLAQSLALASLNHCLAHLPLYYVSFLSAGRTR